MDFLHNGMSQRCWCDVVSAGVCHQDVEMTHKYFHIWLKISVKTKILLVGNAPLSLVNPYAQVTKKRPIFH